MKLKNFITILIINIICNSVFSQIKNPEIYNVPSINKINGNVDVIVVTVKRCELPGYSNKCDSKTMYYKNGAIYKQELTDKNYRDLTTFYTNDSINNFYQKITTYNDKEVSKTLYKHDKNKNLIESKSYNSGKLSYKNVITYKDNKKISEKLYRNDKDPSAITYYKYNTNGKLIEKTKEKPSLSYSSAGFEKIKYTYNTQQLISKALEYNRKNELKSTTNYYYNDKEQLIKNQYSATDNNTYNSTTKYEYKNGYLSKVIYTNTQEDLNETKTYKYKFDEYKNLIDIIITSNNDTIYQASYNFKYK